MSKALNIWSATAPVAPDLLKSIWHNSIRHNCQKICSWLRKPKTILEIRKKDIFLNVISNPIICKFFKDFTNHRKKTNRAVVISSRPFLGLLKYFLSILNTGTTNETLQKSGKQEFFRHILKSSSSIHESYGSEFFRATTGTQSGPAAFDESRFVVTFLTIFRVIEILWSFRLVLKGKTGKETTKSSRLEFLEEFSANNFALSDAEDNKSRSLNRGGIADLTLLRTISNSWNVLRATFLGSDGLFVLVAYTSSAVSRTKKVISMNYGRRKSCWKP